MVLRVRTPKKVPMTLPTILENAMRGSASPRGQVAMITLTSPMELMAKMYRQ